MPVQGKVPAPPAASEQQITVCLLQWQTTHQRKMVWKLRTLCALSEKEEYTVAQTVYCGGNLCIFNSSWLYLLHVVVNMSVGVDAAVGADSDPHTNLWHIGKTHFTKF